MILPPPYRESKSLWNDDEILPQRKSSSPATSGSPPYHSPSNYLIAASTEDGLIPRCVRVGACVRSSICGGSAHARAPARSRLSVWILAPPRYTCSCPCVCACACASSGVLSVDVLGILRVRECPTVEEHHPREQHLVRNTLPARSAISCDFL